METKLIQTTPDDLDLIANWMQGDFSTAEQITSDGGPGARGHFLVEMHLHPCEVSGLSGLTFYVEQGAPGKLPYRQRVYELLFDGATVRNRIYEIANAMNLAGCYKQGAFAIAAERLTLMEGCDVVFRKDETGAYIGNSGEGGTCRKSNPSPWLAPHNCITSDIRLTETCLESLDRGWMSHEGELDFAWGPTEEQGGHRFTRI